MNIDTFFQRLWEDYVQLAPQALRINSALEQCGERIVNDHVAFRTLALRKMGIPRLEPHLLKLGYQRDAAYSFPAKHLRAYGYLPPAPELPRIFLSELLTEELSSDSAAILHRCAAQIDPLQLEQPDVFWQGRMWEPLLVSEYDALQQESEYAAWVAALGIRPNHFTISVNHLQQHPEVEDVLQIVEGLGLPINEAGGRVKGSSDVLLEQASTMADRLPMEFADGLIREIPTCYYEFAKRYPDRDGRLFQGFVAASAERIFESTDATPTGPPE